MSFYEVLVAAGVRVALLVVAIKLFLWARRQAGASDTRWRRRVGLLFVLAPLALTLGERLLPAHTVSTLRALTWVRDTLEGAVDGLVAAVSDGFHPTGVWRLAVYPLCYALVFGVAGVLIGWPLDRLAARRRDPQSGEGGSSAR